ncbi:MAG TPA: hypothetical protein VM282_07570 [Acidimicrobiales bacterium]|nr:hypothetical protein [Acidimicrobiales bacterium]
MEQQHSSNLTPTRRATSNCSPTGRGGAVGATSGGSRDGKGVDGAAVNVDGAVASSVPSDDEQDAETNVSTTARLITAGGTCVVTVAGTTSNNQDFCGVAPPAQ